MLRKPTTHEIALWAALPMAHTTQIEGRLRMILDHTRPRRALTRRALLLALTPGAAALVALAVLRLEVRAQAALPAVNPASPAPLAYPPQTPGTIARSPIGPGPQHPLMRQEGAVARSPTRLASLPKAAPPGAELAAERTSKHLHTRPRKAAPRIAPPVPMLPTVTHVAGGIVVEMFDASSPAPFRLRASRATFTSVSQATGPANMVFSPDLTLNDTTLLAGVTDADKPGGAWWSASGAPLTAPVYDTSAYRAENHADARTHNVSFAVRLPATARGLTVQYEVPQSRGFSSDGFWPTKIQENAGRTEAEVFPRTGGARVLTAAFPASLERTSLRVGFAAGAWKVAATYAPTTPGFGNMDILPGSNRFLFSPISETKDGTVQSITTDVVDDLRVVAVDAQGKETLPLLIGGNSAGALDQITARFALPLAQIKEIRVETRPFRWVEFRDVALHPVQ